MAKKAKVFEYKSTATGTQEVTGYKKNDIIQINGADPSKLRYARDGKNLIITVNNLTLNVVNYFKAKSKKKIDTVRTIGADGTTVDIKISTDANINYTSTDKNETFNFGKGIGTIDFATNFGNDTVVLNKGERVNLTFADSQFGYEIKGKDIVVTAMKDDAVSGTVKLKNFAAKDTGATVSLNGSDIKELKGFKDMLIFDADDVSKKGKLKTTALDDRIRLADYISTSAKGVTVDAGAGNDVIVGSKFNDTIKASSGNNTITEQSGINKITTGKGNDKFYLSDGADGASSNTVKSSGGDNFVEIRNSGTNKVTLGSGTDEVYIYNGTNTVNAGSSGKGMAQYFRVAGGVNTLNGGKSFDMFETYAGYNTINSGAGIDTFLLKGGVNKINAGAGDDALWIYSGTNIIQGGAGNDAYHIKKSTDEILKDHGPTIINDSKGNDIYNISSVNAEVKITDKAGNDLYNIADFENDIVISDSKGNDTMQIHRDVVDMVLLFNVDRKKGAVGDLKIVNDNLTMSGFDFDDVTGVQIVNYFKKSNKIENFKAEFQSLYENKELQDISLNDWTNYITQNVQGWLSNHREYKDAMAAFNSGDDVSELLNIYVGSSYRDAISGNVDDVFGDS